MSTLKDYYNSTVAPAMMKKFGYQNVMQIPKLDKVVVNVAAGEAKDNAKEESTATPSTVRVTTPPVSRNS